MHYYFPPKNFTDSCWLPDKSIGQIPCRTACFVLIEDTEDEFSPKAILRGCVDRLLLFGMDDDVKDAIITYHKSCRSTDRHLLQLISLSKDSQYVLMCTCEGKLCNDEDMRTTLETSSASKVIFLSPVRYIIFHVSIIAIILLKFSLF
uniref:Protein quiver n=1 Tax=Strongyloides papillosus TaxID=174720 RepID=A0A0N5C948_STREA